MTIQELHRDQIRRVDHSLRGLVYWLGWQWNRMHTITSEGAIVGELHGALNATAPDGWTVSSEVLIKDLIPVFTTQHDKLSTNQRVDLVLHPTAKRAGTRKHPPVLIEVKRTCSGIGRIKDDVRKLGLLRQALPNDPLALLIVTGQNSSGYKKLSDPRTHGKKIIARPDLGIGDVRGKRWQHVFPSTDTWRGHHAYMIEVSPHLERSSRGRRR